MNGVKVAVTRTVQATRCNSCKKGKQMLSKEEIKRFIDDDLASEKKKKAAEGQRYYEAEHDILQCRLFYYNDEGNLVEDEYRSNIRISHPFFTELADQLAAYMLSFDENPIRAKEQVDGLQDHLDDYFDDEFWAEIGELIVGTYTKGFEYLYAYKNKEDRLSFECADSMGVVEIRAKDTDDNCEYVIYWYVDRIEKGQKKIKRIEVWDSKQIHYFVQNGEGAIEEDKDAKVNPKPHILYGEGEGDKLEITYEDFGFIPFFRMDNNKKQISGLKPIKGLIDDYDLMECGLSNNLVDFDTPLHVVKGFDGDNLDELVLNMKVKKHIGVGEGGDVDVRTVDVPYQARKLKADEDEKNIYRFGFGFNAAQVGDGNITNVVIRSRYTLLDLKANKMETRLKKLLKQILKPVLDEINDVNGTGFKMKDIEFKFTKNIMTNETENLQNERTRAEIKQLEVNTILNVAAQVGDEQALKAICEVMDWDFDQLKGEIEKLKAEQELLAAQQALEGVETIEEPIDTPIDTPAE